jgi:hypothetical protein
MNINLKGLVWDFERTEVRFKEGREREEKEVKGSSMSNQ